MALTSIGSRCALPKAAARLSWRHSSDGCHDRRDSPGFNARTRVHEYGAETMSSIRAWLLCNFTDQHFTATPNSDLNFLLAQAVKPRSLICVMPMRFFDSRRSRLICVREDSPAKES